MRRSLSAGTDTAAVPGERLLDSDTVMILVCVLLIAFVAIKVFKVDLAGAGKGR